MEDVGLPDAVADALVDHTEEMDFLLRYPPPYYAVSRELLHNLHRRGIYKIAGREFYMARSALPWIPGGGPAQHIAHGPEERKEVARAHPPYQRSTP